MTPPDEPSGLLASVIIPALGRTGLLEKAVRSVINQDLDPARFELIVVDTSPDDRNVRLVERLGAEARCSVRCLTKSREGPGRSRNFGAREATGRFLVFLDSDCDASPQWLREGVAAFADGVGLVQGCTIPDTDVPPSVFNRTLRNEEEGFIYETANIFYRREAFEHAGGFPADYDPAFAPLGGDDCELAWQVKRNGWQSRFAAGARVVHPVLVISPWRWLCERHLFVMPRVAGSCPEIRPFLFARYFLDRAQAGLCLALVGFALAFWHPLGLLLALPYALLRGGEPTRAMRGPLRLVRVLVYLPRDLITFGLLVAGSVHSRSLLL